MNGLHNIKLENINLKEINKELLKKYAEIIRKRLEEFHSPLPVNSFEHIMKELLIPDKPTSKKIFFIAQSKSQSQLVLGYGLLRLNTGQDNLNRCRITVYILPEYRKQGIAKELVKYICHQIPDQIIYIEGHVRDYQDKSHPLFTLGKYLQKIAGKMVLSDRSSASEIRKFNLEAVENEAKKLRINAENQGYDIYFVENGKFKENPAINYPSYVKMVERIWNDMPRDDGSWEDEVLTEEYHQADYRNLEILGETVWTIVAVHQESRKPIAYTEVWLQNDIPSLAMHDDTGVLAEHRGKGLGLTIKYQLLDRLLTHEKSRKVKYWKTGNANSNKHMLRINDILGYKEVSINHEYEFDRIAFVDYFT